MKKLSKQLYSSSVGCIQRGTKRLGVPNKLNSRASSQSLLFSHMKCLGPL